jgi:hypothetical protein
MSGDLEATPGCARCGYGEARACLHCGTVFLRNGRRLYCSLHCTTQANEKRRADTPLRREQIRLSKLRAQKQRLQERLEEVSAELKEKK